MSAERSQLPPSIERNPALDDWIAIEPGGTVRVRTGKVEYGQGIVTAIALIAADELDVAPARVRIESADTDRAPNELYTVGSASIEESGAAVRLAAATARAHLLRLAAIELRADVSDLSVDDGTITDARTGRRTDYWAVLPAGRFERAVARDAPQKPASALRLRDRFAPRIDLGAKLRGGAFLHDLRPEGLLYGRVVRPPALGFRLRGADIDSARAMPGVFAVVRSGSFLGVVAAREEQAVRAREALTASAVWEPDGTPDTDDDAYAHLLSLPRQSFRVVDGMPTDDPIDPLPDPAPSHRTLSARYLRPFQMHASIGPSAALAEQLPDRLTVWSHTQGVFPLRAALAHALGEPLERVRVIHAEGPGCYGHNGADDVALDAALLARAAPGRPVLAQWMREDEHAFEPYGSAMVMDLRGDVDAQGRVAYFSHEVTSYTHLRPIALVEGRSDLLAAAHLDPPLPPNPAKPWRIPHGGIHRNAQPIYDFPAPRVVKHFVEPAPVRVSTLRSLGAFGNVFAMESFIDELAHAASVDPLTMRLRHLRDPRARAVLEQAAARAGYGSTLPSGHGLGLAVMRYKQAKCYAAIAVSVEVSRSSGCVRTHRMVIAADAGRIIDRDGLVNQLEGGAVQALSWTLLEAVQIKAGRVASRDWDTYPILRFADAPRAIDTIVIDRPDAPPLGAGEATQGLVPGAVANAIYAAIGVRLREIPFTPERVLRACAEQGGSAALE